MYQNLGFYASVVVLLALGFVAVQMLASVTMVSVETIVVDRKTESVSYTYKCVRGSNLTGCDQWVEYVNRQGFVFANRELFTADHDVWADLGVGETYTVQIRGWSLLFDRHIQAVIR
jgi:hypothetical protein